MPSVLARMCIKYIANVKPGALTQETKYQEITESIMKTTVTPFLDFNQFSFSSRCIFGPLQFIFPTL